MTTSRKPLGGVSLYSTVKKWAAEFNIRGGSVDDDGRSGRPKDATTDENVKVVHTLAMCDSRQDLQSIASEVGIRFVAVQTILTDILGNQRYWQDGCHEC